MRMILTDKSLEGCSFPKDVEVKSIPADRLADFDHNKAVVAIAGSRAMASACAQMDLPSLRLFQLTSAGFDGVPCETYAEKNIAVANAGTVYSVPIAETVVFGILLMAKKLRKNPNHRRIKLLRHYHTITELNEKRALILGAGNIGTAVAERLAGFGVQVDGYDPFCTEKPQYSRIWRNRKDLLAHMDRYDYVISTMPDNEQTRGFFDGELLGKMKCTAVVVNVGRKAVFDEPALYQALKKKQIGGAVLDMFEKLPNPITNKFRRLHNVVVLPGVAAISQEVNERLKRHMYQNLLASLNGEPVSNVINGVE